MRNLTIFLLVLFNLTDLPAAERVDIGLFSQQELAGWKHKEFAGTTLYTLQQLENTTVLSALSEQSASAFYKEIHVDLEKTPVMNWSWLKKQGLNPGDENTKSGDDFAARVYVIKDGGLFFWKTLVINYVWSFSHKSGSVWENPFAGKNAQMLAQRDSSDPSGVWITEKRNIVADFKRLHGKTVKSIDGVAIMTDSDNSGLAAAAFYGDIYFSAE
jgi:hypothetical protein